MVAKSLSISSSALLLHNQQETLSAASILWAAFSFSLLKQWLWALPKLTGQGIRYSPTWEQPYVPPFCTCSHTGLWVEWGWSVYASSAHSTASILSWQPGELLLSSQLHLVAVVVVVQSWKSSCMSLQQCILSNSSTTGDKSWKFAVKLGGNPNCF